MGLPHAAGWVKPLAAIASGVPMFVLAHVGWLMFRETDFHYLLKYATQSPFAADRAQVEAGAYLFLTVLTFSWPLFAARLVRRCDGEERPRASDASSAPRARTRDPRRLGVRPCSPACC